MADEALDLLLHQPVRLQIAGYLYRNRQASFTELRDELGLTAGNLQSHGEKLREAEYIEINRVLAGIFEVRWRITDKGDAAFVAYFAALRALMEKIGPPERP